MSEQDFHFTFHFSNFQYPLSQDTVISWLVALKCFVKNEIISSVRVGALVGLGLLSHLRPGCYFLLLKTRCHSFSLTSRKLRSISGSTIPHSSRLCFLLWPRLLGTFLFCWRLLSEHPGCPSHFYFLDCSICWD